MRNLAMVLRDWIRAKWEMTPRKRVSEVTCGDEGIEYRVRNGESGRVTWDEIRRVVIRTTDQGPFDDDVFFVVEGVEKRIIVPQGVAIAGELLQALQRLSGFDHGAVIESMGCTDNHDFLCWEKDRTQVGD